MLEVKNNFTDKYSGLISFFLVYSYAMSFVIDIIFSTSNHILVYFTVLCGGMILFLSLWKIVGRWCIQRYVFIIITFLLCFLALLILTKISYTDAAGSFDGVFKSFLVRAFPSAIAGLLVGEKKRLSGLDRFIAPIIILVSITLIVTVLRNPSGDITLFIQLGIDRQTLSYVASYMICWSAYYWVNFSELKLPYWQRTKLCKLFVLVMAISDLWPLLAGGGRGAIVLLAFFFLYYFLYKIRPFKSINGITGIVLFVIVAIFLWKIISQISSLASGLARILGLFSGTLDRSALERVKIYSDAIDLFLEHPLLGGGPGYALCRMGIWSHNIFLDLLADVGVIGTSIFVIWFIYCLRTVFKRAKHDRLIEAGFILGMTSFIMLCFSGSYISDGGLWFFLTYCIAYNHNCIL